MATVHILFHDANANVIGEEDILTGSDTAFVLDDISNWMHEDGEFYKVPKGTKEIQIRIPCDM